MFWYFYSHYNVRLGCYGLLCLLFVSFVGGTALAKHKIAKKNQIDPPALNDGDLFTYHLNSLKGNEILHSRFDRVFNLLLLLRGEVLCETPYGQETATLGSIIVLDKVRFSIYNTDLNNEAQVLSLSFTQAMMQRFKKRYSHVLIEAQNRTMNSGKNTSEGDAKDAEVSNTNTKDGKTKSIQCCLPLLFAGCNLTRMAIDSLVLFLQTAQDACLLVLKLEELLLLQLGQAAGGGELAELFLTQCDPSTARFREYVEVNYLKDWPLDKFAKNYAVSLTTFKSQFNRIYKASPKAWINEQRLRYADQLLRTNNMRIIDVALNSGFSSQSYFCQAYKSRFGVTPRKVRQENQ